MHWLVEQQRRSRRRKIEAAINEYFDTLHTTLYGQAFDLSDPRRREQAVQQFADLYAEIESRVGL